MEYIEIVNKVVQVVGTQKALADKLKISNQAVSKWKRNGIPAIRARQIENLTGGKVTCQQLRPDIFGEPPSVNSNPVSCDGF